MKNVVMPWATFCRRSAAFSEICESINKKGRPGDPERLVHFSGPCASDFQVDCLGFLFEGVGTFRLKFTLAVASAATVTFSTARPLLWRAARTLYSPTGTSLM